MKLCDSKYSDLHVLEHIDTFEKSDRTDYLREVKKFSDIKWLTYTKHGTLVRGHDNVPTYHLPPILLNSSLYCSVISVVLMYAMGLREVVDTRIQSGEGLAFLRCVHAGMLTTKDIIRILDVYDIYQYPRLVNLIMVKMLSDFVEFAEDLQYKFDKEYLVVWQSDYEPPEAYKYKSGVLIKGGHVILHYTMNGFVYHDNDLKSDCQNIQDYTLLLKLYKRHSDHKH